MLEYLLIISIDDKNLFTKCVKNKKAKQRIYSQRQYLYCDKRVQVWSPSKNMNISNRTLQPYEFTKTPYKQTVSQYVTPQQKPSDINSNCKVFPQKFTVNEHNATYEYRPKVIISGYIVGEPVAFTQTPNLPSQYSRFSPSKQNIQKPIVIQTANSFSHPINLSTSVFRNHLNTTVQQTVPRVDSLTKNNNKMLASVPTIEPIISTVRREDYEKLMNQNMQLRIQNNRLLEQNRRLNFQQSSSEFKDRRILELQRQVDSLRQQIKRSQAFPPVVMPSVVSSKMTQSERKQQSVPHINIQEVEQILAICLSKYRQSILEEQKLLIDRFRLEVKNEELDLKQQMLIQSIKQQHPTHRRATHHEKPQLKHFSPIKQNLELPFRHSNTQRHWKK